MKTKIIFAAIAVIVIVLAFLGIRYWDKFFPPAGVTTHETESTDASTQETTTVKPFVEAQTEIITTAAPTTAKADIQPTTERETAIFMGEKPQWPADKTVDGIPAPAKRHISNAQEFKTEKGKRFVIRLNSFSYREFLDYIKEIESAGFTDKNSRANIPESEPDSVAMFYSAFDGSRSFGIYWYGEKSKAEFDCEIVVCNYDQSK